MPGIGVHGIGVRSDKSGGRLPIFSENRRDQFEFVRAGGNRWDACLWLTSRTRCPGVHHLDCRNKRVRPPLLSAEVTSVARRPSTDLVQQRLLLGRRLRGRPEVDPRPTASRKRNQGE
jgi:hypothetical protein